MMTKVRWSLIAAMALLAVAGNAVQAVPPNVTRITVDKMHCGGCARQMAAQLNKVPGVAKVETNVEAKMMFITPKPQATLSARMLWEAIEKADKTPVKLEGPSGTFTAKPQS